MAIIEETPQDEPEGDAAAQAAVEEAGRQFLPLLKVGVGMGEHGGEGHGKARGRGRAAWSKTDAEAELAWPAPLEADVHAGTSRALRSAVVLMPQTAQEIHLRKLLLYLHTYCLLRLALQEVLGEVPNIILTGEAAADADEQGMSPAAAAAAPQASFHVPGAGSMGMVSRTGNVYQVPSMKDVFRAKHACLKSCSMRVACAAEHCACAPRCTSGP